MKRETAPCLPLEQSRGKNFRGCSLISPSEGAFRDASCCRRTLPISFGWPSEVLTTGNNLLYDFIAYSNLKTWIEITAHERSFAVQSPWAVFRLIPISIRRSTCLHSPRQRKPLPRPQTYQEERRFTQCLPAQQVCIWPPPVRLLVSQHQIHLLSTIMDSDRK